MASGLKTLLFAGTILELRLLFASERLPLDGEQHGLAFGVGQLVKTESYQSVGRIARDIAVGIVTNFHRVGFVALHEVELVGLVAAKEGAETQGEISVFDHRELCPVDFWSSLKLTRALTSLPP